MNQPDDTDMLFVSVLQLIQREPVGRRGLGNCLHGLKDVVHWLDGPRTST